jgi:hypothetical protein
MEWMGPEQNSALDAWMQQWVEGFLRVGGATFLVVAVACALITALGVWGIVLVRRRFWCRVANREVDVEFVSRGEAPRFLSVKACSAFDPPTAIACDQRCLDPHFHGADETCTPAGVERTARSVS